MRWAAIPGLPYEVSSSGDVRHVETLRVLTHRERYGRALVQVTLGYDHSRGRSRSRALSVALAMLLAFRGPRPTPTAVPAYRDGDPTNLSLANLQWGTRAAHYAAFPRPRGETHPHHGKRLVGGRWVRPTKNEAPAKRTSPGKRRASS